MEEDKRIGEFVPMGDVLWRVIAKSLAKSIENEKISIVIQKTERLCEKIPS